MGDVFSYRDNMIANKRWSKMDTGAEVIARVNGLPVTAMDLSNMPSDVDPFDYAFFAPEVDPA